MCHLTAVTQANAEKLVFFSFGCCVPEEHYGKDQGVVIATHRLLDVACLEWVAGEHLFQLSISLPKFRRDILLDGRIRW